MQGDWVGLDADTSIFEGNENGAGVTGPVPQQRVGDEPQTVPSTIPSLLGDALGAAEKKLDAVVAKSQSIKLVDPKIIAKIGTIETSIKTYTKMEAPGKVYGWNPMKWERATDIRGLRGTSPFPGWKVSHVDNNQLSTYSRFRAQRQAAIDFAMRTFSDWSDFGGHSTGSRNLQTALSGIPSARQAMWKEFYTYSGTGDSYINQLALPGGRIDWKKFNAWMNDSGPVDSALQAKVWSKLGETLMPFLTFNNSATYKDMARTLTDRKRKGQRYYKYDAENMTVSLNTKLFTFPLNQITNAIK